MDIRLAVQLIIVFTCLLSIMFSFNYFVHYRVLVLNRSFQREENRRRYRAALLVLAFSALIFIAALSSLVAGASRARQMPQNPGLTDTPAMQPTRVAPSASLSAPAPGSLPAATPVPTSTPTPTLRRATIGNTNGFGANLRIAPGVAAEIVATLSDDTPVRLTDAIQEAGGYTWQLVVLEDGREGWVADIFIIPEE